MDGDKPRWHTGAGDWQRRRILLFVQEFARREGYSPSYREIAEELGLAVSTVSYHLSVLEQDGSLRRGPGQPRTIVEPASPAPRAEGDEVEVPLIGQIAAGVPLDAVELAEETFLLPRRLVGCGTLFMLRVKGDSMTGAAISDGDLVIVRQQQVAENGEIVAARLDRAGTGEATVKTLRRLDSHVWLMPHNPAYQPIPADDAAILGKVVAVVRPAQGKQSRRRALVPMLPTYGRRWRCEMDTSPACRGRPRKLPEGAGAGNGSGRRATGYFGPGPLFRLSHASGPGRWSGARRRCVASAAFFVCGGPAFFFPFCREPGARRDAEKLFQGADVIGHHEAEQGAQMRVGEPGVLQARDRFAGQPGVDSCLFLAQPASNAEVAEPFAEVHPGPTARIRDGTQRWAAAVRPSRRTLIHAAWPLPWVLQLRHSCR